MTIDLKWALPFVMPFVALALFRVLWWLAGAEWSDPDTAALMAAIVGFPVGFLFSVAMVEQKIKWTVKIGGRSADKSNKGGE